MSNITASPALTREQYATQQLLQMPVLDITVPVMQKLMRVRVYDFGADQIYIREETGDEQSGGYGYFRKVNDGWADVAHYMANLTVAVIRPKDVAFVTPE